MNNKPVMQMRYTSAHSRIKQAMPPNNELITKRQGDKGVAR